MYSRKSQTEHCFALIFNLYEKPFFFIKIIDLAVSKVQYTTMVPPTS